MSVAEAHCKFFEDGGGLTGASIKCPHLKMLRADGSRLYSTCSPTLEAKTRAIMALGGTAEELAGRYNPAASHIWNAQGQFDSAVFEQLFEGHGVTGDHDHKDNDDHDDHDNGRKAGTEALAVTRRGFNAFLQERRVAQASDTACTILKFVRVTWERITSGSLDELFQLFADCTSGGEPAIRKATLRFFYTQPGAALAARMRKKMYMS